MTDPPIAAVVMAGGLGTRMRSAVPKHFHAILGRRMIDWVIAAGLDTGADPLVVVASPTGRDEFAPGGVTVVVQDPALGTGDAVRTARAALESHAGDVLVLLGTQGHLAGAEIRLLQG